MDQKDPKELENRRQQLADVTTGTLPDGTKVKIERNPDPTWGMKAPIMTTTTVLPSGLPGAVL